MQDGSRLIALEDVRDQIFMEAAFHINNPVASPNPAGVVII